MSVDTVNNSLISLGAVFDETQDTTSTKKEDPLGRDVFLKMLVAQMENQDPLNPMEGTDFSAQLAQFSSLEQLFNVNDTLEDLAASMKSTGQENVLDYIGNRNSKLYIKTTTKRKIIYWACGIYVFIIAYGKYHYLLPWG